MHKSFEQTVLHATGAKDLFVMEEIQQLWSGYGAIVRYGLSGAVVPSVVVKHVQLPNNDNHPRGWNTDLSHKRKLTSYRVETAWYRHWSSLCDDNCYVPECLALGSHGEETLIVLEDLTASGFDTVKSSVSLSEIKVCLRWLAAFHATFMGVQQQQLWKEGTYWHLATRPDELAALSDEALREAAPRIDRRLRQSPFQTLVHGDAKLANFCFSRSGKRVAAVDFQYVGGGCGMKDLAYFIGSCLNESECERFEDQLLDEYFSCLEARIKSKKSNVDFVALEKDWRAMFPLAWTDFHRFIKGWSPGHWKINGYSERIAKEVVAAL
ncbi:MAG: phosphotransferase [Gammaproteobacteria bacterium]